MKINTIDDVLRQLQLIDETSNINKNALFEFFNNKLYQRALGFAFENHVDHPLLLEVGGLVRIIYMQYVCFKECIKLVDSSDFGCDEYDWLCIDFKEFKDLVESLKKTQSENEKKLLAEIDLDSLEAGLNEKNNKFYYQVNPGPR